MRPSLMLLELLEQPHDALKVCAAGVRQRGPPGAAVNFRRQRCRWCVHIPSQYLYVCVYILHYLSISRRYGLVPACAHVKKCRQSGGFLLYGLGVIRTTLSRATGSSSMPSGVWLSFHFFCFSAHARRCPAARDEALKHPCGPSSHRHPPTTSCSRVLTLKARIPAPGQFQFIYSQPIRPSTLDDLKARIPAPGQAF